MEINFVQNTAQKPITLEVQMIIKTQKIGNKVVVNKTQKTHGTRRMT